ncbi:MAG: TonB-dependent receptor plug domain-containing protein [Asticcacaulis sp.]
MLTDPNAAADSDANVLRFSAAYFRDAQPATAQDMISRLPGFTFKDSNDVRGFAGAAGNVLINGKRPATKSASLSAQLQSIPAADVVEITLIRGGAPGIDMQGQPVIANVIRKTSAQTYGAAEGQLNYNGDNHVSGRVAIEGTRRSGDETLEGRLSAYRFRADFTGSGERQRFAPDGRLISAVPYASEAGGRGLFGRMRWERPLAGGQLNLNGQVSHEISDFEFRENRAPQQRLNQDDTKTTPTELGLQWTRTLTPQTELELIALQRYETSETTSDLTSPTLKALFKENTTRNETIGRTILRFAPSATLRLEGGGEMALNWRDDKKSYAENGKAIALPSANVRVEELRGEVFAQASWQARPDLSIEAALRVERSTLKQSGDQSLEKTFVYPKPRLQVNWALQGGHQLRLRTEREVGQLSFGDFSSTVQFSNNTVTAGNANLEPYKRWAYELAYEKRFWNAGALVLTYTHYDITDVTDRVPIIGPDFAYDAPGNIGDGWFNRLNVDLTLPMSNLGLKGAQLNFIGNYYRSEVTDPVTKQPRRISGLGGTTYEIRFVQDLPALKSKWGWSMASPARETSYRVTEVSHHRRDAWLQAYAEYNPTPDWRVRLTAVNLLSRQRFTDRMIYSGPRNTSALLERNLRFEGQNPGLQLLVRRAL